MDFERIKLLLDVFHGCQGVPGTKKIADEALAELQQIPMLPEEEEEE